MTGIATAAAEKLVKTGMATAAVRQCHRMNKRQIYRFPDRLAVMLPLNKSAQTANLWEGRAPDCGLFRAKCVLLLVKVRSQCRKCTHLALPPQTGLSAVCNHYDPMILCMINVGCGKMICVNRPVLVLPSSPKPLHTLLAAAALKS